MLIVAGINLAHLEPRVWDKSSEYYLEDLEAVMISYAEIHLRPQIRARMMSEGIRGTLQIPDTVKVFIDNGSFSFSKKGLIAPTKEYEEFIEKTKPDWKPIPQDFIPSPKMSLAKQNDCLDKTMAVNIDFKHNGFVPVIHISKVINKYIRAIKGNDELSKKKSIAIGGIVPNLLRTPKALSHKNLLKGLASLRTKFPDQNIHIFGVGGIATLHLASVLGIDSVDSSGWRNRAARGIIMLPGKSERSIADLGSWSGRQLTPEENAVVETCKCPACQKFGIDGLTAKASFGFRNRASHNLWVLLQEEKWIRTELLNGTYLNSYIGRIENSTYRSLITTLTKNEHRNREK